VLLTGLMSVRPRLTWGRLFCPDAKARQGAGTEDVGERHIGGIATVRDFGLAAAAGTSFGLTGG
jgi:hypothetical protein